MLDEYARFLRAFFDYLLYFLGLIELIGLFGISLEFAPLLSNPIRQVSVIALVAVGALTILLGRMLLTPVLFREFGISFTNKIVIPKSHVTFSVTRNQPSPRITVQREVIFLSPYENSPPYDIIDTVYRTSLAKLSYESNDVLVKKVAAKTRHTIWWKPKHPRQPYETHAHWFAWNSGSRLNEDVNFFSLSCTYLFGEMQLTFDTYRRIKGVICLRTKRKLRDPEEVLRIAILANQGSIRCSSCEKLEKGTYRIHMRQSSPTVGEKILTIWWHNDLVQEWLGLATKKMQRYKGRWSKPLSLSYWRLKRDYETISTIRNADLSSLSKRTV